MCTKLPWIRGSPTKKAKKDQRFPCKESEEGTLWSDAARLFKSSDQSNYHITPVESGLIGRSDEHRTQTALKPAFCFDDKIYLRCAALVNQVHTRIVSKNVDMKNSLRIPEITLGWNKV